MRRIFAAAACAFLVTGVVEAKEIFTVADAIEMTRVLDVRDAANLKASDSNPPILRSPDGTRYAMFLVRGDLARNGVWLELLAGELDSLTAATQYRVVTRQFTKAEGAGISALRAVPASLLFPYDNRPRWLDNTRVGFRWVDESNIIQVLAVDVVTGKIEYLTRHPTNVAEWAIDSQGQILYSANPLKKDVWLKDVGRAGFAVTNRDLHSFLAGRANDWIEKITSGELWLTKPGWENARQIQLGDLSDMIEPLLSVSPNGHRAIISMRAPRLPTAWDRYTESKLRSTIPRARREPDWVSALGIRQYFVVTFERLSVRPLWDAPFVRHGNGPVWSPSGRSVLLAPTFMPAGAADNAGLAGDAAVEVDVETGEFWRLPLPVGVPVDSADQWEWVAPDRVVVNGGVRRVFGKQAGQWRLLDASHAAAPAVTVAKPRIRVELQQSVNSPAVIVAIDSTTGRKKLVRDLNPGVTERFSFGKAQIVEWQDKNGTTWHGRLYYPVNYQASVRYPMVIQTHGLPPSNEFSVYGHGFSMGPNYGVNVAQPLANRGMAVLQMEDQWTKGIAETPLEAENYAGAYQAAIDKWVALGVADRQKIGLTGYSRTGWHVQYTLTHSNFPYAAAVTADNMDPSYAQRMGWVVTDHEFDQLIGAAPFGDGLKLWLERSPGFNVDKIKTPLQMQSYDFGMNQVAGYWELFSRLRQLRKPVELYVIPDVEQGDHGLQNPAQCLGAQERVVDWLDFWLNGHEEPVPTKVEQYRQWRKLRQLQANVAQ